MPTTASVMAELKKKGTEKTRAIYARHGMITDNRNLCALCVLCVKKKQSTQP